MQIGSIVKWSSQAAGCWKEKQGKVVAVVPARDPLGCFVGPFNDTHRFRLGKYAFCRNAESYLVEVPAPGKGKPSLYWPLTSKLTEVIGGG
jgi:hypothetical protein